MVVSNDLVHEEMLESFAEVLSGPVPALGKGSICVE
jgi:hypothetical protein